MSVISGSVEVLDPIGLHARPASQIVKLVKDLAVDVLIGREGEEFAKANSALRLMALQIKPGEVLIVEVATDSAELGNSIISQIQEFLKG
jgi:phosphotransferase system HPr (HPr) family protein